MSELNTMSGASRPSAAPAKPKPKRKGESRIIYLLREAHFWIGIVLCLPFVALGLSGSYLTYHDEIDAFFGGAPSFEASSGPAQPANAILAAALTAAEPGDVANSISLPREEGEPAIVRVGPAGANFRDPRSMSLAVDPATLDVLGAIPNASGGIARFMHDLHGRLMISGGYGRQIVGWLGVGMLLLGISGLVLWWPRPGQLKQALTIKMRAKGYRFHRDLHGVIGFWTLSVFVVVCFTGVYISFPQAFSSVLGISSGPVAGGARQAAAPAPGQSTEPALTLAQAIDAAQGAVQDATPYSAMLPFRPGMGLRVAMAYDGMQEGAPAIIVTLDPASGQVTEIRDPRLYPANEAFQAWQRPLHMGLGLGPIWQFLVFLSGFLPLLFSITGVAMWWIKRRNRKRMQMAA